MTEKWKEESWASDIWYSGKVTRRRLVGWGGGAVGAMMLMPAPWRAAFGAAKPYKIGSEQPLSGPGAPGPDNGCSEPILYGLAAPNAARHGAGISIIAPTAPPPQPTSLRRVTLPLYQMSLAQDSSFHFSVIAVSSL